MSTCVKYSLKFQAKVLNRLYDFMCSADFMENYREFIFYDFFKAHKLWKKRGTFFNEVNFDRFSNTLKTIIFWETCFFLKGQKKSRSLCKFLYGLAMKNWVSCRFAILNLGGNIFSTSFSLQNEAEKKPFFSALASY